LRSRWRRFRLKLALEPSSNRLVFEKKRNSTFSNAFGPKLTPRWGQDRPKIEPRRVQDRLGSLFFRVDSSHQFLIVLGSVLVPFLPPKWGPGSAPILGNGARGRSKTVLGSPWFGPFFVLRFGLAFLSLLDASWARFGVLLGSFLSILGALGPVLGRLGLFLGTPDSILQS